MRRLVGLAILNMFRIRGVNGLRVIDFNKPVRFWDGTETLSYSYRLTASFHPRNRYVSDMRKLAAKAAIWIGEDDEAVDAQRLRKPFARESPATQFNILSDTNHFGIFTSERVVNMVVGWLGVVDTQPLVKAGAPADRA